MAEADPKHLRNKRLASNDNEIEDTASSKPKVEKVEMTNVEIMKEILVYLKKTKICPTLSPGVFEKFYYPYIQRGVGNQRGWLKKMEEVKTKFNTKSAPTEDVDKHEFELWMKIWGE
ncbi:hypothetical protein L1887_02232 [Cichorium endivia]|nr:hypothetical protein L1887_02232 [Cichorium endivia]